jgi:hypothetical protein
MGRRPGRSPPPSLPPRGAWRPPAATCTTPQYSSIAPTRPSRRPCTHTGLGWYQAVTCSQAAARPHTSRPASVRRARLISTQSRPANRPAGRARRPPLQVRSHTSRTRPHPAPRWSGPSDLPVSCPRRPSRQSRTAARCCRRSAPATNDGRARPGNRGACVVGAGCGARGRQMHRCAYYHRRSTPLPTTPLI